MTLAQVLIAQGSADSLMQADSLLTRLETFVAGIHNIRFLIEVPALQASLHDAQGDEPAAREVLGRAVARPRRSTTSAASPSSWPSTYLP
jgi:hypothetical protein